jgi:hypothetical protein
VLHCFFAGPPPFPDKEGRISREGVRLMQKYLVAAAFVLATAAPALAAEHFAVVDTVGNCSVIDTKPSPHDISGLRVLGNKSGYSNPSGATQALKSEGSLCKGTIARA